MNWLAYEAVAATIPASECCTPLWCNCGENARRLALRLADKLQQIQDGDWQDAYDQIEDLVTKLREPLTGTRNLAKVRI